MHANPVMAAKKKIITGQVSPEEVSALTDREEGVVFGLSGQPISGGLFIGS